jgi:lipopolysaccharide transport system ATP-binding protein
MTAQPTKGVELLRLEEVGLSFPQRKGFLKRSEYWALEDISFSIHQGETIGVIGRNGVGKTTLLRLLSNIISPDRGRVWRKKGLRTALLSLQAGFIPTLTGRQNAVISGITLGLTRRQIERCIPQVIEFSELRDFIDQPVAAYSAGMNARLGFSVAMHVHPDILLIDEVISVGDENFRKKSAEVIHERVKANETTVLVTHNAKLAESLCSRIVWIEGGRIRMLGGTKEVLDVYLAN